MGWKAGRLERLKVGGPAGLEGWGAGRWKAGGLEGWKEGKAGKLQSWRAGRLEGWRAGGWKLGWKVGGRAGRQAGDGKKASGCFKVGRPNATAVRPSANDLFKLFKCPGV